MWKIKKPSLEDAINDISTFEEMRIIEPDDVMKLQRLVRNYDSQKGSVTERQLNTIPGRTANSIKKHYSDTYAGKRLNYLSLSLKEGVHRCPCCSISEVGTLDHYMPKTDYKALALCRLNLVPMCWGCNNTKSDQPYREFIHAYYTELPANVDFLVANIKLVMGYLVVSFTFDSKVITDKVLYNQLVKQWNNLNLDERLHKAVIDFLHNDVIQDFENLNQCKDNLIIQIERYTNDYGRNDWRTAVLRGILLLIDSPCCDELFNVIHNEYVQATDVLI